jgi:hypothetical protein
MRRTFCCEQNHLCLWALIKKKGAIDSLCTPFRRVEDLCCRRRAGGLRSVTCLLYVEKDNAGAQAVYRHLGMQMTPYQVYEQDFLL